VDCQYKDSKKEAVDNDSRRYVRAECNYKIGIKGEFGEDRERF
jgi:hypothetical protein